MIEVCSERGKALGQRCPEASMSKPTPPAQPFGSPWGRQKLRLLSRNPSGANRCINQTTVLLKQNNMFKQTSHEQSRNSLSIVETVCNIITLIKQRHAVLKPNLDLQIARLNAHQHLNIMGGPWPKQRYTKCSQT